MDFFLYGVLLLRQKILNVSGFLFKFNKYKINFTNSFINSYLLILINVFPRISGGDCLKKNRKIVFGHFFSIFLEELYC